MDYILADVGRLGQGACFQGACFHAAWLSEAVLQFLLTDEVKLFLVKLEKPRIVVGSSPCIFLQVEIRSCPMCLLCLTRQLFHHWMIKKDPGDQFPAGRQRAQFSVVTTMDMSHLLILVLVFLSFTNMPSSLKM